MAEPTFDQGGLPPPCTCEVRNDSAVSEQVVKLDVRALIRAVRDYQRRNPQGWDW